MHRCLLGTNEQLAEVVCNRHLLVFCQRLDYFSPIFFKQQFLLVHFAVERPVLAVYLKEREVIASCGNRHTVETLIGIQNIGF